MRKPGKRAVTKQLEVLNSIQGKGPVDWAVVVMLTSWPNLIDASTIEFKTSHETYAARQAMHWMLGVSDVSPVEYLGYAELPEPPTKLKRTLYFAIAMIVAGVIGFIVTL